jgi:hypothetical protein
VKFRAQVLLWLLIFFAPYCLAEETFSCGEMPAAVTGINRDVKSDISASIGSIGKVGTVSVGAKTEVEALNLFSKYPNVDRLVTLQMMSSTYCTMLRSSKISDSEKLDRWERFQDKILALKTAAPLPVESSATLPSPASPNGDRARKRLQEKKAEPVETRDLSPKSQDTLSVETTDLGDNFSKAYCHTMRGGNILSCKSNTGECMFRNECLPRPHVFYCFAKQELGKTKALDCSTSLKKCREDFDLGVTVRNMYNKPTRFSYGCFETRPPTPQ